MRKLIVAVASLLASLGLIGAQDEPQPPEPPQVPEPADVVEEKKIEVNVLNTADGDDPAEALREAYDLLARLRNERLDDRSKALLDKAMALYRQSVEAYGKEGEGQQRQSQGTALAVRELARTIERLNGVRRMERSDPELPPPPRPTQFRARLMPKEATKDAVVALPPPIPPVPPAPPAPPAPPGTRVEVRTFVYGPGGQVTGRPFVFVEPRKAGDSPRIEVRIAEEKVAELNEMLRKQAAKAQEEAAKAAGRALDIRDRIQFRYQVRDAHGGPAAAHRDLQRAYERITKAREEFKGDDAKFYLDAARDLYNAARRDAEAGRHERASELARAAEALTLVPRNLAGIKGDGDEPRPAEARRKVETRLREYRIVRPRRERDEPKEEDGNRSEPKKDEEPKEAQAQDEVDAKVEVEVDADRPESIEGIGLALGIEDDRVVVNDLVEDGPAAKDGRLQKGDVLVGVKGEDGETVTFEGKELGEIVGLIRGKGGTKVALVVRPKGTEEEKVYELTRGTIRLPEPAPAEAGDALRETLERLHQRPTEEAGPLPPPLP